VFVKICGITSEEDALLAVAVGADAVGFVFAPSQRQVAPLRVAEIVRRLPHEILTVGVFRNESPERVISICHQVGLGAAQLHGSETPSEVAQVKAEVRTVFKGVVAGSRAFERGAEFGADALLVEGRDPGSGRVFDWRLAEDAPSGVPLIMAGGLDPNNVAEAIDKVRPWGVDVSTGVERAPGKKDPILVRDFVREAQAAYRRIDPAAPTETFVSVDPAGRPVFGPEPYDWKDDPTWR
jgi:phosphoribosylanthranilate isomerase